MNKDTLITIIVLLAFAAGIAFIWYRVTRGKK